jgi:hypothetical protein
MENLPARRPVRRVQIGANLVGNFLQPIDRQAQFLRLVRLVSSRSCVTPSACWPANKSQELFSILKAKLMGTPWRRTTARKR